LVCDNKENLQILVVDDEENIVNILTNALSRLYSVKSAKNFSDAAEILGAHNVDVLITDLNLAGESGITLAKVAKQNDKNIEIIFITGHASFENTKAALDLGVVAYMTKPIDIMELFSVVEKALHTRKFNVKTSTFSKTISQSIAELENHIKQIVSIYNLLQRMNQAIDINDTVRLLLAETSKMLNTNALIMGINCLGYTDIYAYSSKEALKQETVTHLLTSFWKREMARAKLTLLNIGNKAYPVTIFNEDTKKDLSPYNNTCTLVTSISIFGEEIGFISCYHDINTELDENDEGSFYILPPLIAPAIYRGYLERKSQYFAQTDGLTGVANRRAFHDILNKEFMRAVRHKSDLSFLMMDIDFFKKINDTYGHIVGDDVLKKLTETTSSIIRNYDFLARFGGEEFAVILPNTDTKDALKLAERIRDAIERTSVTAEGNKVNFTVSIGVATFYSEDAENLSGGVNQKLLVNATETLIRNSDEAMYTAKKNNRNCIYHFDAETNSMLRHNAEKQS
jgi:diguanylate cyclase (GGDEF)-like protein